MQLRGKQKRFLRAQANHLQPLFSVGKDGLTDNWLAQLDGALDRRELRLAFCKTQMLQLMRFAN